MASNVTLVADWRQTDWASRRDGCNENNAVMGGDPNPATVAIYFSSAIALNAMLYAKVPKKWRALVHGAVTAIEITALATNHHAGQMAHANTPGTHCDGIPW